MYPEMKSDRELWFDLFQKWDRLRVNVPDKLESTLRAMKSVSSMLQSYGVGSPTPPYTLNDVYDFAEHTNALWSFANSIHSEVEELIDLPFTKAAGNTLQDAYDLNPSDITVTRTFSPGGTPVTLSITDVFVVPPLEVRLKVSLGLYAGALEVDSLGAKPELAEILKEAAFWQGEYEKAKEVKAIAGEVFPPDVREDWPNMTSEERDEIAQAFVREIGIVLGRPNGPVVTGIEWKEALKDEEGNPLPRTYAPRTGTIICVSDGCEKYLDGVGSNVERMIDSIVHESYHMRQYRLCADPEAYSVPQSVVDAWNEPYLDSTTYGGTAYSKQPIEYDTRAFAALCI